MCSCYFFDPNTHCTFAPCSKRKTDFWTQNFNAILYYFLFTYFEAPTFLFPVQKTVCYHFCCRNKSSATFYQPHRQENPIGCIFLSAHICLRQSNSMLFDDDQLFILTHLIHLLITLFTIQEKIRLWEVPQSSIKWDTLQFSCFIGNHSVTGFLLSHCPILDSFRMSLLEEVEEDAAVHNHMTSVLRSALPLTQFQPRRSAQFQCTLTTICAILLPLLSSPPRTHFLSNRMLWILLLRRTMMHKSQSGQEYFP